MSKCKSQNKQRHINVYIYKEIQVSFSDFDEFWVYCFLEKK